MPRRSSPPDTPPTSVSAQSHGGDEEMSDEEMSHEESEEMIEYPDEQKLFVEVTEAGVAVSCSGSLADFTVSENGKQFVRDLYGFNVASKDLYTREDRRKGTITLVNKAARVGLPVEHFEEGDVEGFCSGPPENWSEVGAQEWEKNLEGDMTVVPESVQGTTFGWEYARLPQGETGPDGCRGYMRKLDPVSGVESRWQPNSRGWTVGEDDRIR